MQRCERNFLHKLTESFLYALFLDSQSAQVDTLGNSGTCFRRKRVHPFRSVLHSAAIPGSALPDNPGEALTFYVTGQSLSGCMCRRVRRPGPKYALSLASWSELAVNSCSSNSYLKRAD